MTLDELAAVVIGVETDDLPELGRIHTGLGELKDSEALHAEARRIAGEAAGRVERVILREVADPVKTMESVAAMVSEIQQIGDRLERGETIESVPDEPTGEEQQDEFPLEDDPEAQQGESAGEEAPASDESPKSETTDTALSGDAELLTEFVTESLDHLEQSEGALLDIETNPEDSESINAVFRAFHTVKGTSGFLGLDLINKVAHKAETLLDRARQGEIRIEGGYADLALDSVDVLKQLILNVRAKLEGAVCEEVEGVDELLTRLENPDEAGEGKSSGPMRVGDILVGQGKVDRETLEKAAAESGPAKIGKKLVRSGAAKTGDVVDALRTQKRASGASAGDSMLRVSMRRLDKLIDMVGELVIAQAMVTQDPGVLQSDSQVLGRKVGQLGKITRELHDLSLSMRMIPLKSTFQKMSRLVRDLARKSGKSVRFVTDGEETEIDRNVVESINDPLVHMMRNAVDHGVESPEDRAGTDKPAQGTVVLRAYHEAGEVVIEIQDDGAGLDRDKILNKAVEKGLADAGREYSQTEVFDMLFLPGFSTAKQVTDVSGRGVGMDVVKRNIESMRGRVEIASTKGEGSTFIIRLPLTLAIIDGMLLKVGPEHYILPTLNIDQAFRPERSALSTVTGRGEMVMLRGELIPVFRLDRLFDVSGAKEDPTEALLVVIEHEGQRVALLADQLLGQQQVVIKSLGGAVSEVDGVSGAAIMGDGRVGLILDAAGVIRVAHGDTKKGEAA